MNARQRQLRSISRTARLTIWAICVLGVITASVIVAIIIGMWPWLRRPPTYSFQLPREASLSEAVALKFSKKALAADRKLTVLAHPILNGGDGRYLVIDTIDPNSGHVQWATSGGTYCIRLKTRDQAIDCRVFRLK